MILETKRLKLREWDEKDAPFLFTLNSDPNVIKYTGDTHFNSTQEALLLIKNYQEYKNHGYGRWICELKSTGEAIGWAGLKNQIKTDGIIDLGYRFLRKHWNQGYGFESASGCLNFGFTQLNIEKITGRAAVENIYSHSILKKIGLKQEKQTRDCHGIEAIYYSLTREEYLDRTKKNML